jgi:SpoVK/Ycf46/Vps4 family AAA+-type ATPase
LKEALDELNAFDGLEKVKEAIDELVKTAENNYKLELDGRELHADDDDDDDGGGGGGRNNAGIGAGGAAGKGVYQKVALNRLFLGNPGTGKTSIAKIYGKILKELKYLTDGSVESKVASDFVGSEVGGSQKKTREIIANCEGKVLLIDEAYGLDDALYVLTYPFAIVASFFKSIYY